MESRQQAACKNCYNPDECELKEQLTKLITEYARRQTRSDGVFGDDVVQPIRARGLCASCSLKMTCLDQLVEGGVWHCENYV
jgi:hypothetical protein